LIECLLGCRARSPLVEAIVRIGASGVDELRDHDADQGKLGSVGLEAGCENPCCERLRKRAGRVRNLKSAVLSLSVMLKCHKAAALSRADSFSHGQPQPALERAKGGDILLESRLRGKTLGLAFGCDRSGIKAAGQPRKAQALGPIAAFELASCIAAPTPPMKVPGFGTRKR